MSYRELREIDKQTQEYPILKNLVTELQDKIKELESQSANSSKSTELLNKEIDLLKQKIELLNQEVAMQRRAFEDMKEVADRAIKLAEVSKPGSSIWTTIGLVLGGILVGIGLAGGL